MESLIKFDKNGSLEQKLYKRQQYSIVLDTLAEDRLPKCATPGTFLVGEIGFYKESKKNKIVRKNYFQKFQIIIFFESLECF